MATVTGKPLHQGGIRGHREATGRGLWLALRCFTSEVPWMKQIGLEPGLKGKTVIIMGFGNVGHSAGMHLLNEGAKIIGIIEKDVSIYNPEGIDPNVSTLVYFNSKPM